MTTSSLLTLDNARMRFGIVLAQSQPSVKVVQITDRDRARAREAVRDKEERLIVRTDTVYIEKRDSVFVSKTDLTNQADTKKPGFLTYVKWITALICAVVVLILVLRFGKKGIL